MADKPNLIVVERREVVIMVFIGFALLALVLTLGIRYGILLGKREAHEMAMAGKEIGEESSAIGTGTLGKGEGAEEKAGDKPAEHGAESKDSHGEASHGEEGKADSHGAAPAEKSAKGEGSESHSPEAAPKAARNESAPSHEVADKSSDEYLLNALKDTGVEPPGGKAPREAKLPDSVKEAKPQTGSAAHFPAGSYVIQVGSHPTANEAQAQLRQLKGKKIKAEVLPAFKDRQGEWHRVVLGSYKTKRDAEREASALKSKGSITSYFVWRLP